MTAEVLDQSPDPAGPGRARPWDGYVPAEEEAVCRRAGFAARQGFGERPAVLVIDAVVGAVGDRRADVAGAIVAHPDSCGEQAWRAVLRTGELVERARRATVPVVYLRPFDPWLPGVGPGIGPGKHARWDEPGRGGAANEICAEVAPRDGDHVVQKPKPSAFFGTNLEVMLRDLGVDSLIVTGGTTSGCVRASVVDAASFGYRVAVVEECVFDRLTVSHAVALFDMDLKYADVVPFDEAAALLDRLAPRGSRPA